MEPFPACVERTEEIIGTKGEVRDFRVKDPADIQWFIFKREID